MPNSTRISLRAGPALEQTFAALKHPNYRLWFIGQLTSLVGTWTQTTAQGYLIYDLTHNPAYLGYASFASGLPALLLTLYGGVISDRFSRRNMLICTQLSMMVLAFILAGLVFTGSVQPWQILALSGLLGIANAFDTPARQAFVVELVEREDMTNAIALNATMFNGAAVVGPAAAGLIYAWLGPAWCFTINGISYIAVLVVLLMMRLPPMIRPPVSDSVLNQIREGIGYVRTNDIVLTLTLTAVVVSIFGQGLISLLPAWAVNVLGGNETTNGLLYSARGLGALCGALMIAAVGRHKIRGTLVSIGVVTIPILFIIFSMVRLLPLSILFMLLIGLSFMMVMNSANALIQNTVPDHLRGRIMSIYTLSFNGGLPLGALIAGWLASKISEPMTVVIFAIISLTYAVFLLTRKRWLHRIG